MGQQGKKKKGKTIGEMCNSRMAWHIKPNTQVVDSKKNYTRKEKHKGRYAE